MDVNQSRTEEAFAKTLGRLIEQTNADRYDPFKDFPWTESVPEDAFWMSPDLLSIHGTPYETSLDLTQRLRLSKWECINFFSLNVTGIRELLSEMIACIHTPGFEVASEYLHHLVAEENEHMWYFSRFCNAYAGKIYKDRTIRTEEIPEADIRQFVAFTTILIFEEIVDHYNYRMGKDETLPPIVREINRLHHQDETRHITYGRMNAEILHGRLRDKYGEARMVALEKTLKRFMCMSMQKMQNPEIYKDARIPEWHAMRAALLNDPVRHGFNEAVLSKSLKFMVRAGIFKDDALPWPKAPAPNAPAPPAGGA